MLAIALRSATSHHQTSVLAVYSSNTRLNQSSLFFFNDTATTEIYTLSLHDALPICNIMLTATGAKLLDFGLAKEVVPKSRDRKSTRLNSSHLVISYAVFCLKKKNNGAAPSFRLHVCPAHSSQLPATCQIGGSISLCT